MIPILLGMSLVLNLCLAIWLYGAMLLTIRLEKEAKEANFYRIDG